MTPKEKALELFRRFWQAENSLGMQAMYREESKICAFICVEEIETILLQERVFESLDYWKEVKQEIEKL